MVSSSHDLGAEIRMHSFTVNCDSFSNEEKVAAVVPVTSVDNALTSTRKLYIFQNTIFMKYTNHITMDKAETLRITKSYWTCGKMFVSEDRERQFKPSRHQYVASLSKTLSQHCFCRLSCEMIARR